MSLRLAVLLLAASACRSEAPPTLVDIDACSARDVVTGGDPTDWTIALVHRTACAREGVVVSGAVAAHEAALVAGTEHADGTSTRVFEPTSRPLSSWWSRREIGNWMADATGRGGGAVERTLLPDGTTAVFVAAVPLHAAWAFRFPRAETKSDSFETSDGRRISVPTMRRPLAAGTAIVDGVELVDVPLFDRSVLFALPPAGSSPHAIAATLDRAKVERWTRSLETRGIYVQIPRFSVRTTTDLASLAGARRGVTMLHDVAFVVDEDGVDAPRGSSDAYSGPTPSGAVRIDRPFLFFLREGDRLVLGGLIDDPTHGASETIPR